MAQAFGRIIEGSTPGFVATAKQIGRENASKTMSVTLWLKLRNQATLDRLAGELYDKNSPNYRHWLKAAELKEKFAPSAQDVKTVR